MILVDNWYVLAGLSSAVLIGLTWLWMKDPPPFWVVMLFTAAAPFLFYSALMAGADPRYIGVVALTFALAAILLLERARRK